MKRVLALTLACIVVSLVLVSVAILVERSQTQVENLPEIRRCKGGVCFFTIAPDESSMSDAQAALKKTQAFAFATFRDRTAFNQSPPFYHIQLVGAAAGSPQTASCC